MPRYQLPQLTDLQKKAVKRAKKIKAKRLIVKRLVPHIPITGRIGMEMSWRLWWIKLKDIVENYQKAIAKAGDDPFIRHEIAQRHFGKILRDPRGGWWKLYGPGNLVKVTPPLLEQIKRVGKLEARVERKRQERKYKEWWYKWRAKHAQELERRQKFRREQIAQGNTEVF